MDTRPATCDLCSFIVWKAILPDARHVGLRVSYAKPDIDRSCHCHYNTKSALLLRGQSPTYEIGHRGEKVGRKNGKGQKRHPPTAVQSTQSPLIMTTPGCLLPNSKLATRILGVRENWKQMFAVCLERFVFTSPNIHKPIHKR